MSIEESYESDNYDDNDFHEEMVSYITQHYLAGHITDDNPSVQNGLTGLEQVIAYTNDLNPLNEWDLVEIEFMRQDIMNKIKYEMNKGSYVRDYPIEIIRKDTQFVEFDSEEIYQQCVDHFGSEEEYTDWIDKVARNCFIGRLTNDNFSPRNDLTGLEQFIISYIELDLYQEEDVLVFYRFKTDIKNRISDYKGGCCIEKSVSKVLGYPIEWE
jgi:hypothetical protein